MPEIHKLARSYYSNKASVEACQALFDDPENEEKLEQAFYSVLPILGIIVRKEFRYVDDFSTDDLIQIGAIEYWKLLSNEKKKPRPFDARAHLNLYYKVGLRAMLKARDQIEPEVANFFEHNAESFAASFNFRDPLKRVFLKEIPLIAYERVLDLVDTGRFSEDECAACEYIAQCLIFEMPVIAYQVRKLGGKRIDIEFFESYVDTLVRRAYSEIRAEMDVTDMYHGARHDALDPIYYSNSDSEVACTRATS